MAELLHNPNQQFTGANRSGRIEYIDALRGFTMILVVFHHVVAYCWHITLKSGSMNYYFLQMRMPMFFFISGFVLYKASVTWDWQQIVRFFRKKIPVQLIAPFIFFLVFIHVSHIPFVEAITNKSKAGYWFTFVLLVYYVFYATIRFCIRNERWAGIVMVLLGLVLYKINLPAFYNAIPLPESVKGGLSMIYWEYFLFFVLGTLVKRNFKLVEKYLDKGIILTVCILFYFLVNGFRTRIPINRSIIELLLTLSALVFVFSFFRIHRARFSKEHALGRTLQYIGRRTLDVYLIHFFLIPERLSNFNSVFLDHPMQIIADTSTLVISLIIIAMSLLIGNIIRLSPLLAHWVFGTKITKPETPQTHVNDSTNQQEQGQ